MNPWADVALRLSTRRGVWSLVGERLSTRKVDSARKSLAGAGCRVRTAKVAGRGWSVWAMFPPEPVDAVPFTRRTRRLNATEVEERTYDPDGKLVEVRVRFLERRSARSHRAPWARAS